MGISLHIRLKNRLMELVLENPLDLMKFPAGEIGVKIFNNIKDFDKIHYTLPSTEISWIVIDVRFSLEENMSETLLSIPLIKNAIEEKFKYQGIQHISNNIRYVLNIPYIPYARQDRVCNEGESFSAKVIANLINSLNFDEVITYDDHSYVIGALLNNHSEVTQDYIILGRKYNLSEMLYNNKNSIIVSPDVGSLKKIYKISEDACGVPIIIGIKKRNTKTGEITGTEINGDVKEKDCFIFDDICDGGRTFIELAKILKEKGAKTVTLYVTHGIFSKGLDPLFEYIDKIYTTNSWDQKKYKDVKNFNVIEV